MVRGTLEGEVNCALGKKALRPDGIYATKVRCFVTAAYRKLERLPVIRCPHFLGLGLSH